MKHLSRILALLLALSPLAHGQFNVSTNVDSLAAVIPDNLLSGYQNTLSIYGVVGPIADVNLTLNISGGYNGDLYALLSHGTNAAILLNRVGRTSSSSAGYPDAGFGPTAGQIVFMLDDQASSDVHLYRTFPYVLNAAGQLTASWQPDGRFIDPLSSGNSFSAAARSRMLGVFNGMDCNGTWMLFVADAAGGNESILNSWGLSITIVPEPSGALLLAAGLATLLQQIRRRHRQTSQE